MTEEVSLEDLQKQVLDLQKQLEEQKAQHESDAKKLEETQSDLKKARDLNADLFSRVPGDSGAAPKNESDPWAEMPEEEFIARSIEALVDGIAHKKE